MNIPEVGAQFVTCLELGDTRGFMVHPKHMAARRSSTRGVYRGYVAGHGGDVWWIEHEDGTVGAYCYTELAPLTPASPESPGAGAPSP